MNLTARIVAYIGTEEGLVPEMYLDSVHIATWAMGVTSAAGVDVLQYKDNPQPLDVCFRASISLIQSKYLPPVLRAFTGRDLTENQLAAALSFEWNTGAILSATWVKDYVAGKPASAKADIMNWSSHGQLTDRRARERDLFFDGVWPSLLVPLWSVAKPSYRPVHPVATDVMSVLKSILGEEQT